jgi:hypothetical protein
MVDNTTALSAQFTCFKIARRKRGDMKRALVIAVMLTLAVNFAPRDEAQERPKQDARNSQKTIQATASNAENDKQKTTKTEGCAYQSPKGYETAQWILVIVGIITCLVIGWQSISTARATKAMKGSLKLQRLALYQWVVVRRWEAHRRADGANNMSVSFDIVNATKLPLTLERVETSSNEKTVVSDGRTSITPHSRHRIYAVFSYAEEITIQVTIKFIDAAGDAVVQTTRGMLLCNGSATKFYSRGEDSFSLEAKSIKDQHT